MILIQNCIGFMHTNVSSINPSSSVLMLRLGQMYEVHVACEAYVSDPLMSRS